MRTVCRCLHRMNDEWYRETRAKQQVDVWESMCKRESLVYVYAMWSNSYSIRSLHVDKRMMSVWRKLCAACKHMSKIPCIESHSLSLSSTQLNSKMNEKGKYIITENWSNNASCAWDIKMLYFSIMWPIQFSKWDLSCLKRLTRAHNKQVHFNTVYSLFPVL